MMIIVLVIALIAFGLGAVLIVGGLAATYMSDTKKWKAIFVVIAFAGVALFVWIGPEIIHSEGVEDGQSEYQGTPVDSIRTGEKYEVAAIAENETENKTYLLLDPLGEDEVFFYKTGTEKIPSNLKVDDIIMKTKSQGIVIVDT